MRGGAFGLHVDGPITGGGEGWGVEAAVYGSFNIFRQERTDLSYFTKKNVQATKKQKNIRII